MPPRPSAPVDLSQHETSALAIRLERCWRSIQARHPTLPSAIIIVASGQERGRLVKHGHWSPMRWVVEEGRVPEVLIAGETLNREPVQVFGTLLHEAAHGLAFARGVKDTSREGRYHNAEYKRIAEEVGLKVEKDATHGWTVTSMLPATQRAYAECIAALGELPRARRRLDRGDPGTTVGGEGEGEGEGGGEGEGKKESRALLATCGCGRKIRVARKTLAAGTIACGVCHKPFTIEAAPVEVRTVVVGFSEAEALALFEADDERDPAVLVVDVVRRAVPRLNKAWYETLQAVGRAARARSEEAGRAEMDRQFDAGADKIDYGVYFPKVKAAMREALAELYPLVTGRPWHAEHERDVKDY